MSVLMISGGRAFREAKCNSESFERECREK